VRSAAVQRHRRGAISLKSLAGALEKACDILSLSARLAVDGLPQKANIVVDRNMVAKITSGLKTD
jgi:tyrosyl-tRNA synthetase